MALDECARVIQPGARVVLGEHAEGGWAIWSVAGGPPLARYPRDDASWYVAWDQFTRWEPPPTPPPRRSAWTPGATAFTVLLALVLIYVGYHSYRYQSCLSSPGLLSWPSQCL